MSVDIDKIIDLSGILTEAFHASYYEKKIPCEYDLKIGSSIDALFRDSTTDCIQISELLDETQVRVLGLYSERMASLSVREMSVDNVIRGLLALSIYQTRIDGREAIVTLSLLHDAITRIGLNPGDIFNQVLPYWKDNTLIEFMNRSEQDKMIDQMGYEAISSGKAFYYQRNW